MAVDDLHQSTWVSEVAGRDQALNVRKCTIEIVSGPGAGRQHELASQVVTIGRVGTDVVLDDPRVSAIHAELRLERDGYRIVDLGSTNGTWIGVVRLFDAMIAPGSIVALGATKLRFMPMASSVALPLWQTSTFCGLVGKSVVMRRLFDAIDRVAATESTVLISGETGTGKELVAEAIHERSPRSNNPFVVLDCSATPSAVFEAQLFGYEVGSHPGATHAAAGALEAASNGTLFLDEIGEIPVGVQPRLLRALDTGQIRRLGGQNMIECHVRIVTASNRDLAAAVNTGSFRVDLYYRVGVVKLRVPPLRERLDDLELLIEHFLELMPKPHAPLRPDFIDRARKHAWPGNVRELRNAIETDIAIAEDFAIDARHELDSALDVDISQPFKVAKQRVIDAFDREYVTRLLEAHDGNISAAARGAHMDRLSIYKIMQRLGIKTPGG